MQVKVLEQTICTSTGVMIPAGFVMDQVWDGREGCYAGLIGDMLVSIPYDKGALIVEEKK